MKTALRWVPVRRLLAWQKAPARLRQDEALQKRVRWAVGAVARRSPIAFVCFPQCLAAAWMLQRGSVESHLHYGVRRTEVGLETHTWLESGGEVLIGGEVRAEFFEMEGFEDEMDRMSSR